VWQAYGIAFLPPSLHSPHSLLHAAAPLHSPSSFNPRQVVPHPGSHPRHDLSLFGCSPSSTINFGRLDPESPTSSTGASRATLPSSRSLPMAPTPRRANSHMSPPSSSSAAALLRGPRDHPKVLTSPQPQPSSMALTSADGLPGRIPRRPMAGGDHLRPEHPLHDFPPVTPYGLVHLLKRK
jgi:hypothetical protein